MELCSLADMHRHFRVPAASIIRMMEAAGSSQIMLHIYQLNSGWTKETKQHHYHQFENLGSHFK